MTSRPRNSRPKAKTQPRAAARWLAMQAIQNFEERGGFVANSLDALFRAHEYDPRDKRFATELANEVIRRRDTIDTILAAFVTRDRQEVDPEIWNVLRLGCQQLVFSTGIAIHAALNETVELCRQLKKPAAKSFVNGVLRALARDLIRQPIAASEIDFATTSDRILFTQQRSAQQDESGTATERVELKRHVFDDPQQSPHAYLAQTCSLPLWLVERLSGRYSDVSELLQIALWMTTPGRVSLRVNLLQTTREKLLDVLHTAEFPAWAGDLAESIVVGGSLSPVNVPGYAEGWFSVQDDSAMSAVDLLAPQPDEQILDLCAAPGGKTTFLAERMQNRGRIVACDVSEQRMQRVIENAQRLKLSIIEPVIIDGTAQTLPQGPFDAALVDVPCSNTGVMGKRPEARWRLSPASFAELIPLQKQLLEQALLRAQRVVYSTCSIDTEENEGVVQAVLAEHPEWTLAAELHHIPGQPADGAYQALLRRLP